MFDKIVSTVITPELMEVYKAYAKAYVTSWELWTAFWTLAAIAWVIFTGIAIWRKWLLDRYGDIGPQTILLALALLPIGLGLLVMYGDYHLYQIAKNNPDLFALNLAVKKAAAAMNDLRIW